MDDNFMPSHFGASREGPLWPPGWQPAASIRGRSCSHNVLDSVTLTLYILPMLKKCESRA